MTLKQLIVSVLGIITASVTQAASLSDDLKRFNQVEIPADERTYPADEVSAAAFSNYKFKCERQEDFSPKESANGAAKLKEFMAYASAHPASTCKEKIKCLALLKAAAKAGSWRADYIDLIWDISDNRSNQKALQSLEARLDNFAGQGTPIALYGYVRSHEDMPMEEMYRLLKVAIDRGSPQAMVQVGFDLGMRTLTLRPMAKEMLACAKSQQEPGAYGVLGKIAWTEGRWIDAYRLWEEGANLGCEDCIDKMKEFGALTRELTVTGEIRDSTTRQSNDILNSLQRLDALKDFYSKQFLYEITDMTELLVTAPTDMAFHVSDEQIVALIRKRTPTIVEKLGIQMLILRNIGRGP
jgi:hypothetical protein